MADRPTGTTTSDPAREAALMFNAEQREHMEYLAEQKDYVESIYFDCRRHVAECAVEFIDVSNPMKEESLVEVPEIVLAK